MREWTNAPLLVRGHGRLLTAADLAPASLPDGDAADSELRYLALEQGSGWSSAAQRLAAGPASGLALRGASEVELRDGCRVRCGPVFELLAETAGLQAGGRDQRGARPSRFEPRCGCWSSGPVLLQSTG